MIFSWVYFNMMFGTYFNAFTRELWGLWSDADKVFVVKHRGIKDEFTGYNTLEAAELAKKPEERIFQFLNEAWGELLLFNPTVR